MTSKKFNDMIDEIKKLSAEAKLPIEVEQDKTSSGIDSKILLDNIPVVKHDNFYDMDFTIICEYSTLKNKYRQLLERMNILNEKFADDKRFRFEGWVRVEDETKIIYQASIIYKSIFNNIPA